MTRSGRFPASVLRPLALASIIANVVIVVTGGAVRLTGSGLGCPTWPRCTGESYVTNAAMGVHGVIEFGNRMLAWLVGLIAVACVVAVLRHPRRRFLLPPALAVLTGVLAQGVIGGITVHTDLHPSVVGVHFIVSMALLIGAYALWRRTGEPEGPVRATVPAPLRVLTWLTTLVSAVVLLVGTLVTGSGPHAGDDGSVRNGLDPGGISQVHADVVFLLLGLTAGLWFAFRAVGASSAARATGGLLVVELSQGLIGFVQYFTGLPEFVVGAHLLGACLVWLATLAVLWSTRTRGPATSADPASGPAASAAGPRPGDESDHRHPVTAA